MHTKTFTSQNASKDIDRKWTNRRCWCRLLLLLKFNNFAHFLLEMIRNLMHSLSHSHKTAPTVPPQKNMDIQLYAGTGNTLRKKKFNHDLYLYTVLNADFPYQWWASNFPRRQIWNACCSTFPSCPLFILWCNVPSWTCPAFYLENSFQHFITTLSVFLKSKCAW